MTEDLDGGPVEIGEDLRTQHLVGGADANLAASDVHHPIDIGQNRVDFVGDEEHPEISGPTCSVDELGDLLLVAQVKAGQRLIAQQQLRVGDEGLGDAQALLLTTGGHRQRGVGEGGGTHGGDGLVNATTSRAAEQAESPLVTVDPHAHQIAAANRGRRLQGALLRDVTDVGRATTHRPAGHHGGAGRQRSLPEQDPQQGGLSHPVGSQNGDELAGFHDEIEPRPQHPVPEGDLGAGESGRIDPRGRPGAVRAM